MIGIAGFFVLVSRMAGPARLATVFSYTNLPVFFLFAFLVLAFHEPVQKRRTDVQLAQSMKNREFVNAWQYLEALPVGSVLTQIGYRGTEYYPLFGRELQHRPLLVDQDGIVSDELYVMWQRNPENARLIFGGSASVSPLYLSFVQNLIESRVQYILVRKAPYQRGWSERRNVLRSSDRAVNVFSDSNNEIYKLDGLPDRG